MLNNYHIGDNAVLLHSLFEFLGIFIAFRYYLWLKKKKGDHIDHYHRILIVAAALIGSVLGARIVGSMENIPAWLAAPSFWKYFYGNKTMVGGLLGGLAGVELVKKMIAEKQNTGDIFTYPLIIGMMIGRIGCFCAGMHEETYGLASNWPWAMNLGDGIFRHPVALYEIIFLYCLLLLLRRAQKGFNLKEGALFKIFLIGYLAFRFLLDFIKPGWRYVFGLGTIQLTCLLGLIYYARYILQPRLLIISNNSYAR